jgi:hypothetical protein
LVSPSRALSASKVAALLYEQVYLEVGAIEITAGSGGSFVDRPPLVFYIRYAEA